jgi:carbon-monoxide dehydrogenase medium subunit
VRDFIFHAPTSLLEALALLEQYPEDSRPVAGGTALVIMLRQGLLPYEHLIGLERVRGLGEIHMESDGLHIGALARHRDVETSSLVREVAPLLAEVYSRVATIRIRNAATVGGGLVHADPAQDPPVGLLVLEARIRLVSARGERTVPIAEFFTDYYETVIQPGELLTEVIVPPQPSSARTTYLKFLPRSKDDYATVSVAALAETDGNNCKRLRVALGAAASTPLRAFRVEQALEGQVPSAEAVRTAAEKVAEVVDPLADFRGSADYKRDMAVVFTRRALEAVLGG